MYNESVKISYILAVYEGISMKNWYKKIVFSALVVMHVMQSTLCAADGITLVPEPSLSQTFGYFTRNVSDIARQHQYVSTGIVAALTLGAGYVAASAFDWLPAWIPSAQKVCRRIGKALPQQTFEVVAGEVALGLGLAYVLRDVPTEIGYLFQSPFDTE